MITTLNSKDSIKTLTNGQFRAHRKAAWWVGDYATYADAERALQIANSPGAHANQRGIYDGGDNAAEAQHDDAINAHFAGDAFGVTQPVSIDDVRRTIIAGESCYLIGGMIPATNY